MSNHTIPTADASALTLPGYVAGTWTVDPIHSSASFTARHLVSKVRGQFRDLIGEIHAAGNPLESTVTMSIDAASVDTNNAQRDAHLRSEDFLEVTTYPTLTFNSTGLRPVAAGLRIDGELTIKDVTRPVTAELEIHGFTPDQDGLLRAGLTATFDINRRDFNINFHWVLEAGGAMVGDRIDIQLDIEAVLQS